MSELLPEPGAEDSSRQDIAGSGYDLLIQALGTSFSITVGEDPAYVDDVLSQYQMAVANTQGISGMTDPLKVAVLTGFLLCDEINKLKMQAEEERAITAARQANDADELDRLTQRITARIDRVIEETDVSDV